MMPCCPWTRRDAWGWCCSSSPRWFPPGREARTYLLQCQERLGQYRAAVEFRNATWLREERQQELLDWLRHHHLTFVSVDEPQGYASSVPPVAEATTELAYVRFHGRNQETWERRGAAASERFNYWYVDQELQEWVPKIRQLREKGPAGAPPVQHQLPGPGGSQRPYDGEPPWSRRRGRD